MSQQRPTADPNTGRDTGFTLIELLVVVIILGLLAAIAVPIYLNQRQRGIDASLRADLKQVAAHMEAWLVDHPHEIGTQDPADFNAVPFKASPGNRIMVSLHPTRGGYCIFGFNNNASEDYNDHVYALMAYDSTNGGILPGSSARTTGGHGTKPIAGSCGGGRTVITYIN